MLPETAGRNSVQVNFWRCAPKIFCIRFFIYLIVHNKPNSTALALSFQTYSVHLSGCTIFWVYNFPGYQFLGIIIPVYIFPGVQISAHRIRISRMHISRKANLPDPRFPDAHSPDQYFPAGRHASGKCASGKRGFTY